ncbi:DoxX family protein [Streptomyces vietnamensis]|uniref:Membrane protein n=1 Tax=Streptomyces vietnamensis TaxID=362257 RepID=A0A0B5I1Q7_9ACTN|nr:DoxX family protein [Streptomyces vietnamensis]AJF66536.1 membrane protein [Streptomyces vietnamensis]
MNIALWIVAGLMAFVCFLGSAKMFLPRERMAALGASAQWVLEFSPGALKAIGAVELLAAAGLTLPAVLGIAPVLVPVTATGLVLLFVGALTVRLRRGERATIAGDVVYLVLCLFLVWGRFGPEAFAA